MSGVRISTLFKELPPDFVRDSVRDVSLLTSCVFAETHFSTLRKLSGVRFAAIFMYIRGNQTGIYRSPGEYEKFSKKLARLCLKKPSFASHLAKKLIYYTDWLEGFIKKRKDYQDFKLYSKKFFRVYVDFFAYHQMVGFVGEYLDEKLRPKQNPKQLDSVVKVLDRAYTYNEMVVPRLEKYFKGLNISNYTPEEIGQDHDLSTHKSAGIRSVLFVHDRRLILSSVVASKLAKLIDKSLRRDVGNRSEIKGIGIGDGLYSGRVRVITDLNKLNTVRPGEVLIAPVTRPQFNNRIRKAGAIVTDSGGLLSHPSIIAREFGIPCIVGTKIATEVFKDGDMVEVDAVRGIVKKI